MPFRGPRAQPQPVAEIVQLRKSSSAASHLRKINEINYLRNRLSLEHLSFIVPVSCGCTGRAGRFPQLPIDYTANVQRFPEPLAVVASADEPPLFRG